MLLSVIIPPIVFFLSLSVMNLCDKKFSGKKKNKKPDTMKKLIGAACSLLCGMLLLSAIASANMINGDSGISAIAAILTCACVFAAIIVRRYDAPKLASFLKGCAICASVLFAAEILLFNGKSLTTLKLDEKIDTSAVTISDNAALLNDGSIEFSSDSNLTLSGLPEDTKALYVKLDADKMASPFEVSLGMTDDNFSSSNIIVQHKRTFGKNGELTFSFKPYNQLRTLNLRFSGIAGRVNVSEIRALSAIPYKFSCTRFLILFAAIALLMAVKCFRLYAIEYDRKKRSHIIAVGAMIAVCTLSMLAFTDPNAKSLTYTGSEKYLGDPFAMTLDAFENDRVYLDVEVNDALAAMENPYDPDARSAAGALYNWDYAFYNGRYYSYFGAAPVVSFYIPFYKLTGKIPETSMAAVFFTAVGTLFMCLTILAVLRLFRTKPNLILLLLMFPASAAAMGFWVTASEADKYTIPVSSGLCFLMICLYTSITALVTERNKLKPLLLLIGGTALALCVGSRPTISLCAAVLVPYFIDILRDKKEKLSFRLIQAAAFTAPLAVGALLIMKYNSARFGSPFDFGATYQLTVSNINANSVTLSKFPAAIAHYFFQLPQFKTTFPFFNTYGNGMDNYGSYTYTAFGFGALVVPLITAGLMLQPEAFAPKTKELADRRRRLFLIICLSVSVLLAWADFCLGGFINHYIFDFMPLMTLAAMTGIFRGCRKPAAHKRRYILSGASMVLTMIFMLGVCINWIDSNLLNHFPRLLDKAEDMIIFWQ